MCLYLLLLYLLWSPLFLAQSPSLRVSPKTSCCAGYDFLLERKRGKLLGGSPLHRVIFEVVLLSKSRLKAYFVSSLVSWAGLMDQGDGSITRILLCILWVGLVFCAAPVVVQARLPLFMPCVLGTAQLYFVVNMSTFCL